MYIYKIILYVDPFSSASKIGLAGLRSSFKDWPDCADFVFFLQIAKIGRFEKCAILIGSASHDLETFQLAERVSRPPRFLLPWTRRHFRRCRARKILFAPGRAMILGSNASGCWMGESRYSRSCTTRSSLRREGGAPKTRSPRRRRVPSRDSMGPLRTMTRWPRWQQRRLQPSLTMWRRKQREKVGLGKGMFGVSGVGEIVFCEVAWYRNTFQEVHDYQIYLLINVLSHDLFMFV